MNTANIITKRSATTALCHLRQCSPLKQRPNTAGLSWSAIIFRLQGASTCQVFCVSTCELDGETGADKPAQVLEDLKTAPPPTSTGRQTHTIRLQIIIIIIHLISIIMMMFFTTFRDGYLQLRNPLLRLLTMTQLCTYWPKAKRTSSSAREMPRLHQRCVGLCLLNVLAFPEDDQ